MNHLFFVVFLLSAALLLFTAPETFLASLLTGASKSATVCVAILASYSIWLGLIKVWEDSGLTSAVSKRLRPLAKALFKTGDEDALSAICMNLSVNLLGIGGAATPYGIKAANLLDKSENAEYASAMLFVLNATSLQLIPTSIVAVRTAMQSAAPADIILPTLLSTVLSTLFGAILVRLFIPPKKSTCPKQKRQFFKKARGQV